MEEHFQQKRRGSEESKKRGSERPSRLRSFLKFGIPIIAIVYAAIIAVKRSEKFVEDSQKPVVSESGGQAPARKPPPRAAGTPLPKQPEQNEADLLKRACQDLQNIREGQESKIYEAIKTIAALLDKENLSNPLIELSRIAEACGIQASEVIAFLKGAVENGDTRAAAILHEHLESLCAKEEYSEPIFADYSGCINLPIEPPKQACESRIRDEGLKTCVKDRGGRIDDEADQCYAVFDERQRRECRLLPDGPENYPFITCRKRKEEEAQQKIAERKAEQAKCPGGKATSLGLSIDEIRKLDAIGKASELATTRLGFFNTGEPPVEDEMERYAFIFRDILFFANNEELLRRLGVANIEEFKKKYVDEVALQLRTLRDTISGEEGARYGRFADFLETLWRLRTALE